MDSQVRKEALDPTQSFIVEAPAGSGKTELLTLRYLTLLSTVRADPEEVVAVTFTRKAAAEMKQRVITRLKDPSQVSPENRLIIEQVIARDKTLGWHLLENQNRLRIITLDALCMMLSHRVPILSSLGGKPDVHPHAELMYQEAVEQFIQQTNLSDTWYPAFRKLLIYFQNLQKLKNWLIALLSKRDQWMGFIYEHKSQPDFRLYLSELIQALNQEAMQKISGSIADYYRDILDIFEYTTNNSEAILDSSTHAFWEKFSDLCLTGTGDWRKALNKNQGFLSPSDVKIKGEAGKLEKARRQIFKQKMLDLISCFSEIPDFQSQIQYFRSLPSLDLSEAEYEIVESLHTLLPIVVGFLQMVFKETGKVDFIEISLRALEALHDEAGPTETAQMLDYQISHLLVDEFQDTSAIQFKLLETIIREWRPDEGRTLFCVGDPQQSIYRFRGAEVSVFLQAQQFGIANIRLKNLALIQNFRTQPQVLNWICDKLRPIFPKANDLQSGAVMFGNTVAARACDSEASIECHCFSSAHQEAQSLIAHIKQLKSSNPSATIAILVRAKVYVKELLTALEAHTLDYCAKEIKVLGNLPQVIDLIALLRALDNFDDRIAWLALLRSPFLALPMETVYQIASEIKKTIWESLQLYRENISFDKDSYNNIIRFIDILTYWFEQRSKKSIVDWIKSLWIKLSATDQIDPNIEQVFVLLSGFIDQRGAINLNSFIRKIDTVYIDQTSNNPSNNPVLLMTIHQAKGLEFDYVFLPKLDKMPKALESPPAQLA